MHGSTTLDNEIVKSIDARLSHEACLRGMDLDSARRQIDTE
jgi:hypothetical protein